MFVDVSKPSLVDASKPSLVNKQIDRFVELIFGNTFHTPYKEESGMFHAYASSLRSSSLSRQVGSAILDKYGNIISTGTNDVPKAGGGIYDAEDEHDQREFKHGHDSNQLEKFNMLKDVFLRLKESRWLSKEQQEKNIDELANTALETQNLKNMKFMGITEYGREVHAEMDALTSVAGRTESIKGCVMYCTTFPCHICAKHIVSSGIDKLVFIEPYPKSHADTLFGDSISVGDKEPDKVHFKPYFGISPRRYTDLFRMNERKDTKTGKKREWRAPQSVPRFWESRIFSDAETVKIKRLLERMEQNNLCIKLDG